MRLPPVRALFLIALAACSRPHPAGAEETILTFDRATRTTIHDPGGRGATRTDTSSVKMVVCLGDRRIVVYEGDRGWVYDFTRRRMLSLAAESESFSDWSLYGIVSFNDLEMSSRLGLSEGGPGAPPPGTSVLDLETLFSMPSLRVKPGRRESLADSSAGNRVQVSINGRLATSSFASNDTLTPDRAAMFDRFLLYRCHLHPVARRAIVRSGKVPRSLFYRYRDGNVETAVLLTLGRASSAPENSDPTRGLPRQDITDEAFAALAARLNRCRVQCADSARVRRRETSRSFETDALAHGRRRDAAFAVLERAMENCEPPSFASWPEDARRDAEADTMIRDCVAMTRNPGSAGALESARRLENMDRASLSKGYLLDIVVARARLAGEDLDGGSRQMTAALKFCPCAVDGWMDLGRTYRKNYQPVLAWLCFDAARAAAPEGCARLAEGAALERDLEARHPEFF